MYTVGVGEMANPPITETRHSAQSKRKENNHCETLPTEASFRRAGADVGGFDVF